MHRWAVFLVAASFCALVVLAFSGLTFALQRARSSPYAVR